VTVVNLTRIYTRTGDRGQTRLVDMSVADKTDPRVAAYGDVDEANAAIGLALAIGPPAEPVRTVLARVQNELFDLGADLGNPLATSYEVEPLRITAAYIERLEGWCDRFSADLPKLRSFILPGGTVCGAQLHVARTIVRRAERTAWRAVQAYGTEPPHADQPGHPGGINLLAVTYLNRLSDLLFILTRVANGTDGEVLWVPGGDRSGASPDRDAADPA
jgi:cob(I)alamin adenosyltransferase